MSWSPDLIGYSKFNLKAHLILLGPTWGSPSLDVFRSFDGPRSRHLYGLGGTIGKSFVGKMFGPELDQKSCLPNVGQKTEEAQTGPKNVWARVGPGWAFDVAGRPVGPARIRSHACWATPHPATMINDSPNEPPSST